MKLTLKRLNIMRLDLMKLILMRLIIVTLIKELIKINKRIKKDFDGYYEKNKFKGVKDIKYLFNEEEDESAHEDIRYLLNESPFKSIITDIRSNLSKRGHKLIRNGLKYAEEMKDLTY